MMQGTTCVKVDAIEGCASVKNGVCIECVKGCILLSNGQASYCTKIIDDNCVDNYALLRLQSQ